MAIEMVRVPSESPNISNTDDFVGLRYAFGNRNGYVANKGSECASVVSGSILKIGSGRLVLQGVECDIDANGVEITIDNVATKRYYTVYLQVNLALNEVKVLATYDTATYPAIDAGDDLTQNTIGTARLLLYKFEAVNGVLSNVVKAVNQIGYHDPALDNYDYSKGTIEPRLLSKIGFTLLYDGGNSSHTLSNPITLSENIKETDSLLIFINGKGFVVNRPYSQSNESFGWSLIDTIRNIDFVNGKVYWVDDSNSLFISAVRLTLTITNSGTSSTTSSNINSLLIGRIYKLVF